MRRGCGGDRCAVGGVSPACEQACLEECVHAPPSPSPSPNLDSLITGDNGDDTGLRSRLNQAPVGTGMCPACTLQPRDRPHLGWGGVGWGKEDVARALVFSSSFPLSLVSLFLFLDPLSFLFHLFVCTSLYCSILVVLKKFLFRGENDM